MEGGYNLSYKDFEKKDVYIFLLILLLFFILFFFYRQYMTYKGDFRGEHILYVKMDGFNGTVLKINNKYTKEVYNIKNIKHYEYGTYLLKFDIKKVEINNGFRLLEGKILGTKPSKLNVMRLKILNIFDSMFLMNNNLYAFSRAVILGEKSEMSMDMKNSFKYTGLAHLIVISGTHIGIVIVGITKVLDLLILNYRFKYLISFIILTYYCMLVGMSPGIMRAYIMGAIMIFSRLLFEKEDSKKSLLISFIVIIILNPYAIYDVSMQLSYSAVIAILFIYPIVEKFFNTVYFCKIKCKIVEVFLKLLLLSFVIQIFSIPLFLHYFNKLPLFSFVLNIIGVPIGTILIQLLFATTFINVIGIRFLNNILKYIVNFIYNSFEGYIFMGEKIPLLQIDFDNNFSLIYYIIYYIIFINILLYLNDLNKKISINKNKDEIQDI